MGNGESIHLDKGGKSAAFFRWSYHREARKKNCEKKSSEKIANSEIEKSAEELAEKNGLTAKQKKFIAEYQKDNNATQAAIRAGYSERNADKIGPELLGKTRVAKEIANLQKAHLSRTLIKADDVLEKMWQLATFDANEISQYRRGACRYCWGFGHHYQWRDAIEFEEKSSGARAKKGKEPNDAGGYGYNHNDEPNPECPRCNGDGVGRAHFADTTKLSSVGRLAYSGTKLVKGGIEITAISREKMFEAIMRRLGLSDTELAQRLLELEIRKRTAEAERLEHETELKRKGKSDEKPTIVIKLVNSPDDD
ncbi:terminase small subunit [Escherichia sp. E1130]|uniref:terminase small subunit n=1 Tax=Escherichia sp. E1130 TaxID=2041645 RepID=UPI001F10EF0B|nr:terminase small subunit [Escherichia sp. E1130]